MPLLSWIGWAQLKAIIFTESKRTQEYLLGLLADTPYGDGIVLFNGTNSDARAQAIYKDWLKRHEGTDHITGSKTADTRAALVEHFKERGTVMIATEAGAEGINLSSAPWSSTMTCHGIRSASNNVSGAAIVTGRSSMWWW